MADFSEAPGTIVIGGAGGSAGYMESLAIPFHQEVIPKLEELGFTEANPQETKDAYPDSIEREPVTGPWNVLGVADVMILLAFYLPLRIADALIEDVVSDVYSRVVTPALQKVWAKIRKSKQPPQRISTTFDHWFDGSKVLVRVRFSDAARSPTPDHDLIRAALRDAAQRVQRSPVTHRVMTYEVVDGVLAAEPELSEPV